MVGTGLLAGVVVFLEDEACAGALGFAGAGVFVFLDLSSFFPPSLLFLGAMSIAV